MFAHHLGFRARLLWLVLTVALAVVMLALSGCATQPSPAGDHPGFLQGVLHGLIVPGTLVGSIFYDIRMYAFPNGGIAYDFGFVLGYSTVFIVVFLSMIARIGGSIATRRP